MDFDGRQILFRISVVILCFLPSVFCAIEGQIIIEQKDEMQRIGSQVNYLKDPEGELKIEDILQAKWQQKFQKNQSDIFNRSASASAYWFKISLQNKTNEDIWLKIGDTFSTWYADFYAPEVDGKYLRPRLLGSLRPQENNEFPSNYYCVRLANGQETQTRTYYLRVAGSLPKIFVFQVGTTRMLAKDLKIYDYVVAAFVGLIISMILYNSFIYFSTRDKVYVYYILYLIGITFNVTFSSGYPLFYGKWVWDYLFVWQNVVTLFMTLFTVHFLNLAQVSKKFYNWVWFVTFIILIVIPLLNILNWIDLALLANFFQMMVLAYTLSLFLSGVYAWVKGYVNARFYILGWFFVIACTFVTIFTINGLLPLNVFTRHSNYWGFSMEALMFAFALGDRLTILKREKALAQAQNLRLIREQNVLLDQVVKERTEELRATNEELIQSNDELQTINEKLDEQSHQLQEINDAKDRLFVIIGHDLRSPINSLKSLLDLVIDDSISQEEFRHFSSKLKHRIKDVHFTLDNLLHWARTQMQGMQTKAVRSELFPLAQESCLLLLEFAKTKDIRIINKIDKEIEVFADPNQMKLVFRNLISNALKFSKAGKKVLLNASLKGQFYEISVADEGTGMPKETIANLFSQFHVSRQGTKGETGTGLGLQLCQEFVKKNGGDIWVESELDQGTTFYFTLAIYNLDKVSMDMQQDHQKMIEEYITAYNNFDVEAMMKDLHPDIKFENYSNNELNLSTEGIEAFAKQATQAKNIFKEREQSIQRFEFAEENVKVDIAFKAVLATDLGENLKSGDTLEFVGQSVFTFKEGKIITIQDFS